MEDYTKAKTFIERYQQGIFSLALYLVGGDRDQAYEVAAASFVEALHSMPAQEGEKDFLIRLIPVVIKKSREVKALPVFDEADFADLSLEKRKALSLVARALQRISFDDKVLLLLRHQLHFLYDDIASVVHISSHDVRSQTIHALTHFREKVQEVLDGVG